MTQRTRDALGQEAPRGDDGGPLKQEEGQDERGWQVPTLTSSIALVGMLPRRASGILTRKDRKTVRLRLALTAILVSILAVLVASVGNYFSLPHSPEQSVNRYLSALEEGDYIRGLDRSSYSFGSTYLTDSIYRKATGRVSDYRVLDTQVEGTKATVKVAVTVQGVEKELSLPLRLVEKSGPYNDTWVLDTPSQTSVALTAPLPLAQLSVNGVTVDLPATRRTAGGDGQHWTIPFLPGSYSLDLPEGSYYSLVGGAQTLEVALPTLPVLTDRVSFTLRPSRRMWSETDALIQSWLDRCSESRRLYTTGCPAPGRQGLDEGDVSEVRWRQVSRPALYLLQDDQKPDTWAASRYAPAVFEVTYRYRGKAQRETVSFYIDAQVVSDGSQADISVGLGEGQPPVG